MRIFKAAGSLRGAESRLRQLAAHPLYDAAMRLPLFAYAVILAAAQIASLLAMLRQPGAVDVTMIANIAARCATFLFAFSYAMFAACRSRPRRKATGLEPRLSALLGSFLTTAFVFFPQHELPLPLALLSTTMVLFSHALSVFVILRLGRSFSIMAEARQLVTTGIYRHIRHPLYLAEEIAIFGIFIQVASLWTALLLAAQLCFQIRRMTNEEQILAAAFPEYGSYKLRTARLIPSVY